MKDVIRKKIIRDADHPLLQRNCIWRVAGTLSLRFGSSELG